MKSRGRVSPHVSKVVCALGLSLFMAQPALAIDLPDNPFMTNWTVSGWVREYASWNLSDLPETTHSDESGKMSMNRQSIYLDTEWSTGALHWTVRLRGDHEMLTDLQKKLQDLTGETGNRADFRDEYNSFDAREYFIDWQAASQLHFRIGRQQVAWGQTDFFHATDVIQGYDLTWRKFLVAETEQVRKPLFMFNATYDVPALNGGLQVLVRPPIGDSNWVGNSEPTFGGPWANDGNHGFNFISANGSGLGVYNYHYRGANVSDPDYGTRWTGTFTSFGSDQTYALNYYHGHGGFFQDGVVIYDPVHPYHGNPLQMVFPFTDTFGGSISGPVDSINSVYRMEVAYTPNRKMSSDLNGDAPFTSKDAYNFVLGLDTNLYLQKLLHTSNSSLLSVQVFDWFIPGATQKDEILRFDGSGYFHKHNVMATIVFSNPFFFDNLKLGVVGLADLTGGGGMVIPTVDYSSGAHWRFHAEVDKTVGGAPSPALNPPTGPKIGTIFGSLNNDSQFFVRVTYQF